MRASQNGHYNVVEKLLSAGAQPDIQDKVTLLVTMVMLIHSGPLRTGSMAFEAIMQQILD